MDSRLPVTPDESSQLQSGAPAGIKKGSLMVRFVSGLAYSAFIVFVLWMGPVYAGIGFGIMAGIAASEFYTIVRLQARLPNDAFGIAGAAAMPVAAALWGLPGLSATMTAVLGASLVWHVVFRRAGIADTAVTVFGSLYTGFLLAYLVLVLRDFEAGTYIALTLVFSVWANDVFAYLVGSTLGRHKMSPQISPKKSWEGFYAGTAASVLVWVAASYLPQVDLSLVQAALVGFTVAVAGVLGDLAESRIKREAGVKDSGTLMPGHGGFLDRLDSLILVCLVAYWVLFWTGVR